MIKFEHIKLENGLNVYLLNDNSKHTTYINLIVKYGGMDNTYYINGKKYVTNNGVAHLIEHTVLESNMYGDLMNYFGIHGARSNGVTSLDKTVYYVDTVGNIEKSLSVLIDGIHKPIINDDVLEDIKLPIIEEKRRSLDNKYSILYNDSFANIADNKKYTNVLGNIKEIKDTSCEVIKRTFEAFYRPDNEILVISGKFDKDSVLNTIKDTYEALNFKNIIVKKQIYKHNNKIKKKKYVVKASTGISKTLITFKFDTYLYKPIDKLKLDLYLYAFLKMNFGIVSNLHKELIKDNIINGGIAFTNILLEGYHIMQLEVDTSKSKYFINRILTYFKNKEYIFDKELWELYKRNFILDLIIRNDNIYDITDPFIENLIAYEYNELDRVSDYEALNFDEFKKFISRLDFNNYSIGELKDK